MRMNLEWVLDTLEVGMIATSTYEHMVPEQRNDYKQDLSLVKHLGLKFRAEGVFAVRLYIYDTPKNIKKLKEYLKPDPWMGREIILSIKERR